MSWTVLNIESRRTFTVPNSTTANNIVVWQNTTGTNLEESSVPITGQNMTNLNSIILTEQAMNPGAEDMLWIDSATGHLMLGTKNLHDIGGDAQDPQHQPIMGLCNLMGQWAACCRIPIYALMILTILQG
jgi:hypothetical protein